MAYKSLLTVMTETQDCTALLWRRLWPWPSPRMPMPKSCVLGVDRSQTGYYYAGANALIVQETLNRANAEAQDLLAFANDYLGKSGVRWSAEHGVAQIADIGRHVAHRARFSDLVILPHPYGEGRGAEAEPIIEAAMFEGHCPVLVVPDERRTPLKAPRQHHDRLERKRRGHVRHPAGPALPQTGRDRPYCGHRPPQPWTGPVRPGWDAVPDAGPSWCQMRDRCAQQDHDPRLGYS